MSNQREDLTFRWGLDADAFRRQLTRINADVEKSTEGIKGRLAEAFTITAAALAFKELGEKMVELRRKSEDLGVSIEGLQAIEKLGVKFGGSVEQTDNALMKLTLAIGNARTEGGAMAESFDRFGIELYNLNGTAKTTEEVFKDIADAYKNSSDAGTKAALAFEFFGKTGKDINNILDMGSDALTEYANSAANMTTVAEQSVNALADAWLALKQDSGGVISWSINRLSDLVSAYRISINVIGGLLGGLSRREAVQFAQNEFMQPRAEQGDQNARNADAMLRAAKQREQITKATQSLVDLTNQGEEIKGKSRLIGLTIQELALRGKLLAIPTGAKVQAQAERELLAVIAKRAEADRKTATDKLNLLQVEERQIKHQIDRETDILKADQLKVELKKKQNELAAQGNAIAEREAQIITDRNRLQAAAQDVTTRREDRTKYTLAELSTANIRGLQRQGAPQQLIEDAMKAREVARLVGEDPNRLGGQAERARLAGNRAEAERLISQAEAIKSGIGSLKSSERLSEIAETMRKTNLEITEFNRRAAAEGLNTRVMLAK
jgi:hypothetical protein